MFPAIEHYWYLKTLEEYYPCQISSSKQYFANFIDLQGDRCLMVLRALSILTKALDRR
ncbi:MAG: hypothetical protein AAGF83_24905 [Cyanobacteria bacterium P01_G01_bin.67]